MPNEWPNCLPRPFNKHAVWHADVILNGNLGADAFRIARVNINLARMAFDFDFDPVDILWIGLRSFDGAHFDIVAIPSVDVDGAVHVVEHELSAGIEGIRFHENLARRIGQGWKGYCEQSKCDCQCPRNEGLGTTSHCTMHRTPPYLPRLLSSRSNAHLGLRMRAVICSLRIGRQTDF